MIRALPGALLAGLLVMGGPGAVSADVTHRILTFQELPGWDQDDHAAALAAFLVSCDDFEDPEWQAICALARETTAPKAFFELLFRPVLVGGEATALFTGSFEPELDGSRTPSGPYRFPIYRKPPEVQAGQQWHSRAEIEERGLLAGRGLEIAWVDDPVEVFFLQIQGSGRIRLTDGSVIRVGYGGHNGHNYRSVGQEMIARGLLGPHEGSAEAIRAWVRRNPAQGQALLRLNPSYVFFREIRDLPAESGPLGAMLRPITPLRSVAVDPAFYPLGAPVWVEKGGEGPLNRLMVAQDTGSAIKGVQRADIFYGTGETAGRVAGRVKDPGRMVVLLPIQRAYALAPGG